MPKLFLICFLLFSLTTFAGPKTRAYKGMVIGPNQEILAGAKIQVKGTEIVVYSDFDGQFTIDDLKSGTYDLVISLVSFQDLVIESRDIEQKNGELLHFHLDPR